MGDKQTVKALRIIASLAIIVGVAFAAILPVAAETAYGGGSTQAYAADTPIDNGTIVVLTGKDANRVKIATQADVQNMFGVTVDRNSLPLTITGGELDNEVFVAVSGTYSVLVSDQAGAIASGDYITLSSVNGVAMKTGDEEVTVFGRANSGFDGKGVNLGKTTLKDSAGNDKEVTIGSIPVTIDIKNNPNHKSTDSNLPDALKRVGQAIAEKEVSPIRIYLSMGIAAVCLIAALVVLYAGIRNGVISIGRNPMARKSLFRALLEVILTASLILIIGLFAVYLLLKL
ncbi:MAG: hypothetical protein ACOH18_00310 [Candidatus Saccharimonadaceae bacterium]